MVSRGAGLWVVILIRTVQGGTGGCGVVYGAGVSQNERLIIFACYIHHRGAVTHHM